MTFRDLVQVLKGQRRHHLDGVTPAAMAYLLAQLRATMSTASASVLLVTPTDAAAEQLAADCRFFDPDCAPLLFPSAELPYTGIPTDPDRKARRLATLHHLSQTAAPAMVFTSCHALAQTLPPPAIFRHASRHLSVGQTEDRDQLLAHLADAGYTGTPLVEDVGTFATRGAILDCWPPGTDLPVRIEWNFDTIASLRSFDPATQRSRDACQAIHLGPADLVLLDAERQTATLRRIKARADAADIPVPAREPLVHAVQHNSHIPLLEGLLPLLYDAPATLLDYLPATTRIIALDMAAQESAALAHHGRIREAARCEPVMAAIVPLAEVIHDWPTVQARLATHPFITCGSQSTAMLTSPDLARDSVPLEGFATLRAIPLEAIVARLRELQASGTAITVVCHTSLAADRTVDLLRWQGLDVLAGNEAPSATRLGVVVGELSHGFYNPADGIAYITEPEIFGAKIRRAPQGRRRVEETFLSFEDLAAGDPVVHEQHGVARFTALTEMDLGGSARSEYVQLEFLGGDKLYLPTYRLGQLQRYIGPSHTAPPLDRLGGPRWQRARQKVMKSIRTMAGELLKIYAERTIHTGVEFAGRDHHLEEFESAFPYDETPDQWQAIEDTLRDMASPRPMDRLICGDVGYGKTEVAMRAAFRAAMDGHQVALLCPTTLLAFQHYETFCARFAAWPLRIGLLNRFRSREEQKATIAETAAGTIDILIGTHRILQRDIAFPRLGLLIIDEEQRFGVSHKERLRKLRTTVDTLALSATPIPRTLHMSISGLRDISIIQTPPADRHAIRTYVLPFQDRTIREAIRREQARGGQIFFVHNRVQTILTMRDYLAKLVPEIRVVVAHGQMAEHELEISMRAFLQREVDLLLCTSIIEAGLDIPAANTLIVNRADTFGLAQLYQIRGRVGRSSVQASAFLLTPEHADVDGESGITPMARRRLAALARYTDLGSGFSIAMQDLEMRGAGNLLGGQQSGQIAEIGYELYTRLLERTIRQLEGKPEEETIDPEITLPFPALLPASYIADQHLRLAWYKRLASCNTGDALESLEAELVDRFGPVPDEGHHLLKTIRLRIDALALGIQTLQVQGTTMRMQFHTSTRIDPATLMPLVAAAPDQFRLRPDGTLHATLANGSADRLWDAVRSVTQQLRRLLPEPLEQ
jgi:transcription-repair coupling factor (superfamily II helicase)